ncbi:MAG: hypothetical protein ACLRYE_00795 [Gemmiger formicilis]|uniref:hypothetical protein n=1 Tax=Gemmiger formicilis TaxID=745368 RepID=UPI0039A1E4FD
MALAGGYLQTLSGGVQQNGIAGLAQGLAAVFTDLTTNVGPQLLQTGIDLLGKLGEVIVTGIPSCWHRPCRLWRTLPADCARTPGSWWMRASSSF